MEELNLTPSAPVWEKIELEIRPSGKRRRVFLWLFVAALLMAGGWWFGQMQQQTIMPSPESRHTPAVDQTTATPGKQNRSAERSTGKQSSAGPVKTENKPEKQVSGKQPAGENPHDVFAFHQATPERKPISRQTKKGSETIAANKQQPATKDPFSSPLLNSPSEKENTGVITNGESNTTGTPLSASADSSRAGQPSENEEKAAAATDSSYKRKVASAGAKWKKQLWLQGGWSGHVAALRPGGYQDRYASPAPSSGTNGSVSTPAQRTEFNRGFSFATGVGLSKEISKRFSVAVGLQYAYYTVNSKVGAYKRIDTAVAYAGNMVAVGGYFDKNLSSGYTTHYHVLELPVSAAWRPFEKFPLQLSLGASYGWLLNSNALTYNAYTNFSYYNKENNNSSYLNLFSGLQYNVIQKRGFTLSAGPQVQYTLTRLQKQTDDHPPHLFSAGLRTAVSF